MATLLLRTSCTAGRDGGGAARTDDAAGRRPGPSSSEGGGADATRGYAPWTTAAMSSPGVPAAFDPPGFHPLHRGSSTADARRGRSDAIDFDLLASHAIRCDVALVPRVPLEDPPADDESRRLHALRLARQPFHPCGRTNVVSVEGLPAAASAGGGGGCLLSLANCAVEVDAGIGEEAVIFPVAAAPSTFHLSFGEDASGSSLWDEAHVLGGGVHRVGEVRVAFDFSDALALYRERIGTDPEEAQCDCEAGRYHYEQTPTHAGHCNATSSRPEGRSEVASIMLNLEEESRFIRRTLAALGLVGVVFVGALGWTLWKMSKGKQARKRRRVVSDVPREIGVDVTAGGGRSMQGQRQQVTPDFSPLRPTNVVVSRGPDLPSLNSLGIVTGNAKLQRRRSDISPRHLPSDHERAGHEARRVISPHTPAPPQLARPTKKPSPRHWYEDFLSPPTHVAKKDAAERHVPDILGSVSFAKKEEISHALYSPLKSTAEKIFGQDPSISAIPEIGSAEPVPTTNDVPRGRACPPRELNFDTPMARSAFAPPQSEVDLVMLSRRIELSLVLFDEGSGVGSSEKDEDESESPVDESVEVVGAILSDLIEAIVNEDGGSPAQALPQDKEVAFEDKNPSVSPAASLLEVSVEQSLAVDTDERSPNEHEATSAAVLEVSSAPEREMTVEAVGPTNAPSEVSSLSIASEDTLEEFARALTASGASNVADASDDTPSDENTVEEIRADEEEEVVDDEDSDSLSSESSDHFEESVASSDVPMTPERSSDESVASSEYHVEDELDATGADATTEAENSGEPPKLTKVEKYPLGFFEELVEKTFTKARSPNASSSNFSALLAQRAFEVEVGKQPRTPAAAKGTGFPTSLAKSTKKMKTPPKRKLLTPVGHSGESTPDSSSQEFLSDYW